MHITEIHFHPIIMDYVLPVGNRYNSNHRHVAPPELPHRFSMMAVLVTHGMWEEIMGQKINDSELNGDYPAVAVSWWSVLEFANRLSRKHGLPEVYDTSHIVFEGHAEDGTLYTKSGLPKINAPNEDIYQTTGYRLPNVCEQMYVRAGDNPSSRPEEYAYGGGRAVNKEFFPGVNDSNFLDYAWVEQNSGGTAMPVALRLPYIVQGHEFYDLDGNVEEMSNIYYIDDNGTIDGTRMGCNFMTHKDNYPKEIYRRTNRLDPNWRDDDLGFRLVRNLPKK